MEVITRHVITTRQIQRPDQTHHTAGLGHGIMKELEEGLDRVFIKYDANRHVPRLIWDFWLLFLTYASPNTGADLSPNQTFGMPETWTTTAFENVATGLICDYPTMSRLGK